MDELIEQPPVTEAESAAWSWIRRWRLGFLAGGLSCVGLSLVLTGALVATKPAFLTSVIQVWEIQGGTASGGGTSPEKIYKIEVRKPNELYVGDDLPISVTVGYRRRLRKRSTGPCAHYA